MDLRKFDLNLLLVMDALLRDRSVTHAAIRLNLSQPTVSSSLNKLRVLFQDELFVRAARGVEPTALARELEGPIQEALSLIQRGVIGRTPFDARTSKRTFVIITGEIGQTVFVDRLLPKLQDRAPQARVRFWSPDANERAHALDDGRADLAFGLFTNFERPSLFQQKLYDRPAVCVARRNHGSFRSGLTLEGFSQARHLVVMSLSDLNEVVERSLQSQGIDRDVMVELAHSAGAREILLNSDLVAVMPEVLARHYCASGELATWPLPCDIPPMEVKQYWHKSANKDPAVTWLRRMIASEFQQASD